MRYHAAMLAHHARNEEDAVAHVHRDIDALGLRGAAKEQILKDRMAATVAHLHRHPETLAAISKLDDTSQVEELKRMRSEEQYGPSKDTDDERYR